MRQRAQPQECPSSRGSGLAQRRHVGREPASSWEITSERASLPEAPLSYTSEHEEPSYPQHLQYQNAASVESLAKDPLSSSTRYPKPESSHRLQDFHTLFRTPLHVPDNKYQEFLLGQSSRRKGSALLTRVCCAQTCAGFSIMGILFLVFCGILLDTQPLYIKGSLPQLIIQTDDATKSVVQYLIPTAESDRIPAARSAYRAALAYLVVFFVCLHILYPGWFQSQVYRRSKKYQDIPDHQGDNTLPTFQGEASSSTAYQLGFISRAVARLRRWLVMVQGRYYKPGRSKKKKRKYTRKTG